MTRLLAVASGVALAGGDILDAARVRRATASGPGGRARVPMIPVPQPGDGPVSPLGALYRREVRRLSQRYPTTDLSRLDWMVVVALARAFADADAAELARAMMEGSPGLVERKAGHVADYVARTVGKARALVAREHEER